jgi:glutamate-ammonia-ligase adenylyltransferase
MKAEAALLIALADIGGLWDVVQVTAALTEVADTAVTAALRHVLNQAAQAGRLVLREGADPERSCGLFVIAVGKMGAFELNYSSDIDLIIFFEPERAPLAPGIEAGPLFARLARQLIRLLQQRTEHGYVFRVDLRLRPDPASTQIAMSVPAALEYYESRGQNWERAALIKARICAGDRAAGASFIASLSPFIWRKYLDFVALSDIHEMKRQIHAYRGHSVVAVEGHNIKLGRGGIREIEFFVQTQQLIAGGRNPQLRSRETLVTLRALADGGWIDAATCADLQNAYRFLRTVEHRLQMVADEQTTLTASPASLATTTAMRWRKCCLSTCGRWRVVMQACSNTLRSSLLNAAALRFRARRTPTKRWRNSARWASASPPWCQAPCGAGLPDIRADSRERVRRPNSSTWCRCLSTTLRA